MPKFDPRIKPQVGATINWGHPLAKGLRLCLPLLGNGSANPVDLTGNYAPTRQGSLIYDIAGPGYNRGIYSSDGYYQYVSVDDKKSDTFGLTDKITFAARWYGEVIANADWVFGKRWSSNAPPWVTIGHGYANVAGLPKESKFSVTNSSNTPISASCGSDNTYEWVGKVGTYDGSYVRGYKNGILQDSVAQSGSVKQNNRPIQLFRNEYSASQCLAGYMEYAYVWSRCLKPSEVLWLNEEPYAFLTPANTKRFIFLGSGAQAGGGATVSVPLATLTLTGYAPTVTTPNPQTVSVPAGSLTLSGNAPTVVASDHKTVSVPAASLTLAGNAPTVTATANITVSVPAGSLTLAANAPTVTASGNQTVSVPAGSLTLAGYAPVVSVSGNQTVSVPAGSLTLAGNVPIVDVTNHQTVNVPAGNLALQGFAPTVSVSSAQVVSVPAGSLTLTGNAPTIDITADMFVSVPVGSLTLAGIAPTVAATAHQTVSVAVGSLTLAGFAPYVSYDGSDPNRRRKFIATVKRNLRAGVINRSIRAIK